MTYRVACTVVYFACTNTLYAKYNARSIIAVDSLPPPRPGEKRFFPFYAVSERKKAFEYNSGLYHGLDFSLTQALTKMLPR